MLPDFLHRFFWDHPVKQIDEDTHSFFIIERLLELGNDEAIHWVLRHYTDSDIINVVKDSRSLSRKTANFWKNYFRLNKEEITCLQTSSQKIELHYWQG
ncbi:MAG: hypothetical protein KGZ63_12480 [Clostridiales bacterium]|jgi:hypothetical protein|nr:hypothetical protein [Clostridiales bacterium]